MRIREALEKGEGAEVKLRGWVYRQRASKNIAFVVLRDASSTIQCVFKKDNVSEEDFEHASKVNMESSIEVKGTLKEDERAPEGYEVQASEINVVHDAERFPITEEQSTELLLDKRHLWVRSQEITNVMKIRASVIKAAREFFDDRGWFEIQPPLITSSACEGGTTLFEFDYFGDEAYLSQSGQMYAEAMIYSLEKVYCFAPSFRAEKSRTRRHLTEYWHLEPEAAWMNHEENMEVQEEMIAYICNKVAEEREKELKALDRDPEKLKNIETPFERITYTEALEKLNDNGFNLTWGEDFGTKEERFLTKDREQPLIIEKYPLEAKAFYMKTDPDNDKQVLCNDIIAPQGFGEIIGGSERESDNQILIERLKKEGAELDNYEWYLDLRKFGSVPHSGFGLGIERLIRWIADLDHIRDAIPFPRTPRRHSP